VDDDKVDRTMGCGLVLIALALLVAIILRLTHDSAGVLLWRRWFG